MSDRRSYLLVGAAVLAVAAAARTVPLYWSPLPHVLDGFAHAGAARETLAAGRLPLGPDLRADLLVVTVLTATASLVVGEAPLDTIQPALSLAGAAVPLVGVAFTRRLGADLGWPARRVRAAALACGLLLAVQGLFLRHTSIPDPEPLGQLFAFLAVLSLHRLLTGGSRRWAVPLAALLGLFPVLHTFSTLNAALGLTALVGAELARRPTRRTAVVGGGVVAAFWALVAGYYGVVGRLGVLSVAYTGRVRSHPGLFLAWVVVLVVGVGWYQLVATRTRRAVLAGPFALLFALVGVNAVRPVFPGTIPSPPAVVALVALLAVPAAFAGHGLFALDRRRETASVVTATLAAPLALVLFALTADLTPEFFATAIRGQAFLHVPVFVLVGLSAAAVAGRTGGLARRRGVRAALLAALAVATLATAPLAFVALDTLEYPATTPESEFAAVGHASTHTAGGWTTDHGPTRVGRTTFGADAGVGPTRTWLRGGPPPACPMLSFAGWTTDGATFWPAAPATTDRRRYRATLDGRNVVYAVDGRKAATLSLPRDSGECGGTDTSTVLGARPSGVRR